MKKTTDPASARFMPLAGRIATFDQDGTRLAMLILHDDAKREYPYGPAQGLTDTKVGTFTTGTLRRGEEARLNGTVIGMKNDWKRIFAFEQSRRQSSTRPAVHPPSVVVRYGIERAPRLAVFS